MNIQVTSKPSRFDSFKIEKRHLGFASSVILFAAINLIPLTAHASCANAISQSGKTITVQGQNTQSCDRSNIQTAINMAGSGDTVKLKGDFQFDGTALEVTKSNLTITGVRTFTGDTYGTHLKGLLISSGVEAGLPARDTGGYLYFNRPMNIGALGTTPTENVTIQNLHFKDFFRGVAVSSLGSKSNLCSDLAAGGTTGIVRNIKVLLNTFVNSERGPQVFGSATDTDIIGNVASGSSAIVTNGGGSACFPLVGEARIAPGIHQGQVPTLANGGLINSPTPDPVTHICSNNVTVPTQKLLAKETSPGVYTCPICTTDLNPSLAAGWGGATNLTVCAASDSVDAGQPNGINIIANKLSGNPAFLARNTTVVALTSGGDQDNVLMALNDFSMGHRCLDMANQYGTGRSYTVMLNAFHDCGAADVFRGFRAGAILLGNRSLSQRALANPALITPLSYVRDVLIQYNVYWNNIANKTDTSFPINFGPLPRPTAATIDESVGSLYEPVARDIWLSSVITENNTVKEDRCKVQVYDDKIAGGTNVNNISPPCSH